MKRLIAKSQKNSGASLVLVIVCMLFVGIIAAAVLTLTTGNIDAVKSGRDSADNFYSAETVIDEIKSYLQQKANAAATQAYAATLNDIAANPGIDMKTQYEKHFSDLMDAEMTKQMDEDESGSLAWMVKSYNEGNADAFEALGLKVSPDSFVLTIPTASDSYDATNNIWKGISLQYTDAQDFKTSIDTDLQFGCTLPLPSWDAGDTSFGYNIDKFILIGESGITSLANSTSGSVEGSIYSGADIDLYVASSALGAGEFKLDSQYIVAKGDVKVQNGKVNVYGLGTNFGTGDEQKMYLDLVRKSATASVKISQPNANIWAGGISLLNGKPVMKVSNDVAKVYLKDDLSLDGAETSFIMNGGDFYGFSTGGATVGSVDEHQNSSAIVLNGVDSKLDLSGLDSLTLAGTAYTEVPTVSGTEGKTNMYFVQGESVTFKSLQSVYLVPDKAIKGVGHNVMTATEFNTFKLQGIDTAAVSSYLSGVNLNEGNGWRSASVTYTSSGTPTVYYYIFWDFASTDDAVKYFNNIKNTDIKDVLGTKIQMIGNGSIKLPSNVHSKGDLIVYNGTTYNHIEKQWSASDASDCSALKVNYSNITSTLDPSQMQGESLFANMFASGNIDKSETERFMTLKGPANWSNEAYSYTANVLGSDGNSDGKNWNYVLVTGNDIVLKASGESDDNLIRPDTKYVVVSKGDVTINPGTIFNGIIIAGGEIKVGANVQLKCFGNVKRTVTNKKDTTDTKTEYISEFDALLAVSVDGDADGENANTILRQIFGVAGNSSAGVGNSGEAADIAKVGTTNYKKN